MHHMHILEYMWEAVYLFDRSLVLRLLGYAYKLCAFLGPISAYRLWKMQYDVAQSNNIWKVYFKMRS